ncbi:MAG: hypothetical protein AAF378_24925, partial [Cyanobacteria bacterium P01_A01_bin.84]
QEQDQKLIRASEVTGERLAKLTFCIQKRFKIKRSVATMVVGVLVTSFIHQIDEDKELQEHIQDIIKIVSEQTNA